MPAFSRKLLLGFGALGLAASAAATWVHYHLLVNPDYTSFCDIGTCYDGYNGDASMVTAM